MQVILSESYELAVFYEIIAMTFGVLLKICVWPPQYYFWVLHNGIKAILEMIMITYPGPGTGLHRRIMQRIIILPTMCQDIPWYGKLGGFFPLLLEDFFFTTHSFLLFGV